jgi:hypothetical protein
LVGAAKTLSDKEFEQKDRDHKILTDKTSSKIKMWLSLILLYFGFFFLTILNLVFMVMIIKSPKFKAIKDVGYDLLVLDTADSVHQVLFSIFFTIIFYCALARIELLIDVLPDLEKNR